MVFQELCTHASVSALSSQSQQNLYQSRPEASNLASQGQGKLQSRVMGKKSCRNTVPGKPSDLDYIIDPHHHCSGELILKSEMFRVNMASLFFFLIV